MTSVVRRTEGWPVGVYLAALIVKDSARGGHRSSPASTATSLTTSTASRSSGFRSEPSSSCDGPPFSNSSMRLSAMPCSGEADSQEPLREIEASSLFLVPLDRRREWFRYHPLFREFLQGELRRIEPNLTAKLHLRAADWYEANGSPGLAVEHLLNTAERERCIQLVTALTLPTYQSRSDDNLQRWYTALGDSAAEEYPPLAIMEGWVAALTGQTTETQRWADFLDTVSFELVPVDGSASFASAWAMLRAAICPDDPERMLADASFAVAAEPPGSVWRDTAPGHERRGATCSSGTSSAPPACSRNRRARNRVRQPRQRSAGQGRSSRVLAMDRGPMGRGRCATRRRSRHRREPRHARQHLAQRLAFAAAARLAVHQGDDEAVQRQLAASHASPPECTAAIPWLAVRARLQLAKVH